MMIVTIDGPSGAGKGTISRLVSNATGYSLLDSGALYRLTALACVRKNLNLDNEDIVCQVASQLDVVFSVADDSTHITLHGEDATSAIREEHMGMLASKVAAYPKVRQALLSRQRDFAKPPGVVADGRDMGTVVFPQAQVKIFLTASADARAERRKIQLLEAGQTPDYEKILADIKRRDLQDSSRAAAPLAAAEDATTIDCTQLSVEEVFRKVMEIIASKELNIEEQ